MSGTGRKTILIVDDMELNREILCLILQDKYNTLEAGNGVEAKRILDKEGERIALILLDIVMPVMGGFEFLKEIQGMEQFKDIPIIFVTSETYEENIVVGVKLGVKDIIAKPFDPYVVCKRVDNLIQLTEHRVEKKSMPTVKERSTSVYGQSTGERETALIVDDVELNRVIIRAALENSYDILEAANGEEAIKILGKYKGRIAVMLLDIIMPVKDGVATMEEAIRMDLLGSMPVIAITSEDSIPKINKIKELGICEVIQKPFNPIIVKNRVDYMVELSRSKSSKSTS